MQRGTDYRRKSNDGQYGVWQLIATVGAAPRENALELPKCPTRFGPAESEKPSWPSRISAAKSVRASRVSAVGCPENFPKFPTQPVTITVVCATSLLAGLPLTCCELPASSRGNASRLRTHFIPDFSSVSVFPYRQWSCDTGIVTTPNPVDGISR